MAGEEAGQRAKVKVQKSKWKQEKESRNQGVEDSSQKPTAKTADSRRGGRSKGRGQSAEAKVEEEKESRNQVAKGERRMAKSEERRANGVLGGCPSEEDDRRG
ncbi:hypothetical protein FJY69_02660 [candidate division WOR-3 bacterium]|nr:hypothetical protein [candidate division WOR-3 bacterium]